MTYRSTAIDVWIDDDDIFIQSPDVGDGPMTIIVPIAMRDYFILMLKNAKEIDTDV